MIVKVKLMIATLQSHLRPPAPSLRGSQRQDYSEINFTSGGLLIPEESSSKVSPSPSSTSSSSALTTFKSTAAASALPLPASDQQGG